MFALLCALAPLIVSNPHGSVFPTGVTVHDPAKTWDGLTLEISDLEAYHTTAPQDVRARAMDGTIVNQWFSPIPGWNIGEIAKPLKDGHLLVFLYDLNKLGDRVLVEMDWDGNLLWTYDPNAGDLDLHHDFDRLPNGRTWSVAKRKRTVPSITPGQIFDDTIAIVNKSGVKIDEWSSADHFDQLGLSPTAKHLILNLPPGLHDIFHMNSVQSIPPNDLLDPRFRRGNALVSMRSLNRVFVINMGSGNVVWTLSVPTIGQHHARMIPKGLPGAGNILVFDNGGMAGYPQQCRLYSRVIEVDPISQTIVWEYHTQVGPSNSTIQHSFFSPRVSSAQRLDNGNTLITEGDLGRIFEVQVDGTIVWEFVKSGNTKAYRGYRVDYAWQTGTLAHWYW